jgi:hypothetical protein
VNFAFEKNYWIEKTRVNLSGVAAYPEILL